MHPIVDGLSTLKDISESFKSRFIDISKPNNADRVDRLKGELDLKYAELSETHNQSCNCHIYNVSLENVIDATFSMKKGKSFDDENVSAEHFFHAPLPRHMFDYSNFSCPRYIIPMSRISSNSVRSFLLSKTI